MSMVIPKLRVVTKGEIPIIFPFRLKEIKMSHGGNEKAIGVSRTETEINNTTSIVRQIKHVKNRMFYKSFQIVEVA